MKKYTFFELSDQLAIKADFYQWMICKRKGRRWIPVTFHTSLLNALKTVQDDFFKESEAKHVSELIEAISSQNQTLRSAIDDYEITREITR
jgi:hypothetical protein